MTKIFNDPSNFAEEALAGFCDVHSDLVRQVPGGAVRRFRPAQPKVAVLAGGGSGHYPAFAGLIGTGFADGAVVGNIFTSPSAQQAYAVAKAAESGAGVVFTYGNYAGDVMNFAMASERLAAEGIAVENVLVTDDIASAPPSESAKLRGIAGDFAVFKVMGAAAERGDSLADVVRLGRKANDLTRTIGSAFAGCTFPGADSPLFSLADGQMGLGLGIHGEPGLFDTDLPPAKALGEELVARLLAEKLSQALGSPVVVESRAGANGIIASEAVGRSTDGHSLLWVSAAHAINASLYPRLPYDSQRDFAPVALVASPGPMVIAVPAALPVRSLPDLMDLARRKPGQVSYASAGVGNVLHLAGEMLAQQAGVQLLHVPYKGAAPALNDLAAGQVNLMFNSALSVAPMVKDGRIRLLAQTGAQRSPALPADLPTVTETPGLAGFQVTGWFGLLAPAALPAEAIARLNAECVRILAQPELREKLALLGSADAPTQSAREFGAFLTAETDRYARVIRAAGLRLETPSS